MFQRFFSVALVASVAAVVLTTTPSSASDPLPFQQHWDIIDSSGCLDTEWQPRCWNRSSSPVIADIDADGVNEVVLGHQDGYLRAYEGDGSLKWASAAIPGIGPGCNAQATPSSIDSSPAVADLNEDGNPEVIVGVGSSWARGQSGSVIAFDGKTGNIIWQTDNGIDTHNIWARSLIRDGTCEGTFATPAIGDVDGDGWNDVVFASWDFMIWAVDRFGEPLSGFPINNDDTVWSSPALFDIDGDGRMEIFVGGDSTPIGYFDHLGGVFRALDWTPGGVNQLWHRTTSEVIQGSPSIADIDNDGRLELVVTTGEYWHVTCGAASPEAHCSPGAGNDHNKVFAWHLDDGSDVSGWPVSTGHTVTASPAIGDLDGDGDLEVVVGGWDTYVRAWHGDGTPLWSVQPSHGAAHLGPAIVAGHPVIADLDGDGDQDVAVGTYTGLALLDGRTGASFEGGLEWQYRMGAAWSYESAPAVGVLDGTRQIVFVGFDTPHGKTRVAAFDLPGSTSIVDAWPMFRQNAQRTGVGTGVGPAVSCDGFCDVSKVAYYSQPVAWTTAEGISSGVSDNMFAPERAITRAGVSTFIWNFWDAPEPSAPSGFQDVTSTANYADAVAWMTEDGITNGTSPTTFSPHQGLTRGMFATFLWRLAGYPNAPVSEQFTDIPEGQYYTEAVHWMLHHGITTGTSATTFSPGNDLTRGQIATFLWRLAGTPDAFAEGIELPSTMRR